VIFASRGALAMLLSLTAFTVSNAAAQTQSGPSPQQSPFRYLSYKPKASQLVGPLRYENISAQEIDEIEAAARSILPGALVNISGIVAGCQCEEGEQCTAQVRVVAYRPEKTSGLSLSRINGHWSVGLLQQWEFQYAAFLDKYPRPYFGHMPEAKARFEKFLAEQTALFSEYPNCHAEQAPAAPGLATNLR
jgi:hypothetical protein